MSNLAPGFALCCLGSTVRIDAARVFGRNGPRMIKKLKLQKRRGIYPFPV
jgi:hypothetical protein